ncbi:MAG: hypothetical protein ABH877_05510 [bacterium]
MVKEPAIVSGGKVEVEGKVLGELEGLEPIESDRLGNGDAFKDSPMVEEAVPSGAGEVSGDGGVGDTEFAANLAQAGAGDGEGGDAEEEGRPV